MSRNHRVVFVVGVPGAGKTTILRNMALPSDHQVYDNDIRWTLKAPYAFIGAYQNLALDGGDQVARHANILSLEYWVRNILPNPDFTTTFLDGEMFLWARILAGLRTTPLAFVDESLDRDKNYLPDGLRYECWSKMLSKDESRFPLLGCPKGDELGWHSDGVMPTIHLSCAYLVISEETSIARRKAREAAAGEGETKNDDRHMKTAATKQRNFAAQFRPDDTPFFMDADQGDDPYLEMNVEGMSPEDVQAAFEEWIRDTNP